MTSQTNDKKIDKILELIYSSPKRNKDILKGIKITNAGLSINLKSLKGRKLIEKNDKGFYVITEEGRKKIENNNLLNILERKEKVERILGYIERTRIMRELLKELISFYIYDKDHPIHKVAKGENIFNLRYGEIREKIRILNMIVREFDPSFTKTYPEISGQAIRIVKYDDIDPDLPFKEWDMEYRDKKIEEMIQKCSDIISGKYDEETEQFFDKLKIWLKDMA